MRAKLWELFEIKQTNKTSFQRCVEVQINAQLISVRWFGRYLAQGLRSSCSSFNSRWPTRTAQDTLS